MGGFRYPTRGNMDVAGPVTLLVVTGPTDTVAGCQVLVPLFRKGVVYEKTYENESEEGPEGLLSNGPESSSEKRMGFVNYARRLQALMPCFSPIPGVRSSETNANGKRPVRVFPRSSGLGTVPGPDTYSLPCGQCIGCRLERSRQWAMRCVHEAKQHERNCWVTLTYNDRFLPRAPSGRVTLVKRDVQLFLKRLRRRFGKGIRYYYCGEYGDQLGRPHYHLCIFNFDFGDKEPLQVSAAGHQYFESKSLSELWSDPDSKESMGFTALTDLSFEAAAYTARYITKKLLGKRAHEYGDVLPEFTDMSRGSKSLKTGGIGKGWFDQWKDDVYPSDSVFLRDKYLTPPKFYDRQLEKVDPKLYEVVKARRLEKSIDSWFRSGKRSGGVREFIRGRREMLRAAHGWNIENAKQQLKRRLENDS